MTLRYTGLLALGLLFSNGRISAQGCVAIRSFSSCSPGSFTNANLISQGWQMSVGYRYFESYKHFKGTHEETIRQELGNEVINWTTQMDLGLTYNFNKREGISVNLPWSYNVRSSEYEHRYASNPQIRSRHSMRSSGIGDLRVSYNRWLWHPDSVSKGNLQLSGGIKLPTGDFDHLAFWYNVGPDGLGEYRPVDQSIQLGDGGAGLTLALQGFLKLAGPVYGYFNAFYLLNPMGTNGTRTFRETISPVLANENIMSVPDQFMVRAGLNVNASRKMGLNFFVGGRMEGIPVEDLIGPSDGFRRPGYVVSIEPGIDWMKGRHDVNLSVPWAMVRNRTQSVTDKEMSAILGVPRHGDAAFADYTINLQYTVLLAKASN